MKLERCREEKLKQQIRENRSEKSKYLVNLCLFIIRQLELLEGHFNWAGIKGWFFLRGGGGCTQATMKPCSGPFRDIESYVRVKHKLI